MQKQLSDIWVLQRTGEYMNVGKIKGEHQYQGEGTSTVKADRQENADEIQDSQLPNTLFDVWRAWIRLPINPDNGKWEPEKVLPSWHIVTFVGDLDSRQCICTKISPNPNSCGLIPVSINHALEDDKGAFHLGFQDLTKSYLAMEMTLFDLALDNARIRNRVPLLAERNSVMIRDKTFTAGGNQIITYKAGTKEPTEMKVQDTTVSTVPLLGQVEDRRERVQGTGPAFRGEAIGGRQSASGYLGTLDQAMKPAIEDAKYVTFQILPFVGFWVKEMWSDFGDPERKIIVTMQDELREVKPMYIWGDLKIRVTSIKNFQDNALKRREMDEVLTKIVPVMVQTGAATGESLKPLFSEYLRDKHINNVDEIFNTKNNTMQIRQARFENMSILWGGGQEMPSEEDDHKVHIKEHEPYTATIEMLQEGSRPPDASIAKMKEHTQMHKYFLERGQTGQGMPQAQQQQQPNEPASVPTPGEVSGDNLAGGMGTFGNLETASTGRPPMISETQQGGMM